MGGGGGGGERVLAAMLLLVGIVLGAVKAQLQRAGPLAILQDAEGPSTAPGAL